MKKNNILIFGGTGFIGRTIIDSLQQEMYQIHMVIREEKHLYKPNIKYHHIQLNDIDTLVDLIDTEKISTIIHCASSLIPSSQFNEFYQENENIILPTVALLDRIKNKEILYVYFSSGGVVYGNPSKIPTNESEALNPLSYYGLSKKIIEDYLHFYSNNYIINHMILRPSNPYGSEQHKNGIQGFIATALHKVMNGLPIEIWGDGSVIRDYITIEDLAWATVKLIDKGGRNETYNIGSGCGHSLLEVIDIISLITNKNPKLIFSKPRNIDVKTVVLDINKLQKEINFIATPLIDGIRKFYQKLS